MIIWDSRFRSNTQGAGNLIIKVSSGMTARFIDNYFEGESGINDYAIMVVVIVTMFNRETISRFSIRAMSRKILASQPSVETGSRPSLI